MGRGGIAAALGAVIVVGLLGALVGYAVGKPPTEPRSGPVVVTFDHPSPMPARPAVPIDPPPTYAPDPNYPPLATGLSYREQTFRSGPYVWHYDVPVGWVGHRSLGANDTPQVTWLPPAETQPGAPIGGYQLRIAPVGGHSTPGQMISAKFTGLQEAGAAGTLSQLAEVRTTAYAGFYSYRDDHSGRFRLDDFAWVTDPGPDGYVGFELSVSGRARDQAGLDDLLQHVYASVYRTRAPAKAPSASASPSGSPSASASPSASSSATPPHSAATLTP